jgi:hypothetical protein
MFSELLSMKTATQYHYGKNDKSWMLLMVYLVHGSLCSNTGSTVKKLLPVTEEDGLQSFPNEEINKSKILDNVCY